MKKQLLLAIVAIGVVTGLGLTFKPEVPGEFRLEEKNEAVESKFSKALLAREAMEWRNAKLRDENGEILPSYFAAANKIADEAKLRGSRAGSLNLQWEELGPDNVGGRTRAILIDRRDPTGNTIYAGGVSGGLWKSIDGANTWTRLPDWTDWVTISCIDQSPNGTIYVGTGEGLAQAQYSGNSFQSGNIGNGIFKLDANDARTRITPDAFTNNTMDLNNTWSIVNRIACNPTNDNEIYAATGSGMYKTTDAGVTWAQVTNLPAGVSQGGSVADLKWSSNGVIMYASAGGNRTVIMSGNGGLTWNRLTTTNNSGFPSTQGRVEIAIAPSDPNTVYISVATSSGSTYGVYKTTDGGNPASAWVNIGSKGPLFDPFGSNNQGWYDNVIAVSPADPNKVYMGGVDFYTWSDQSGWKLADAGLGAGNSNPKYVHPDKHSIVIDPNNPNVMYIGCDGGVYKSVDALSAFPYPNYKIKNRGYNVTQNYSVGAGIYGDVMGGTQDNGTNYIDYTGNTRMSSDAVRGGDGTYAEISHINPNIMFAGIYFGNNTRSGNGGSSFDGFYDIKIDPNGFNEPSRCTGQENSGAQFISPFWLFETKNAANGTLTADFKATQNYTAGETITIPSNAGRYPIQYVLTADLDSGDVISVSDPIRSRFFTHSVCGIWVTSDALDLSVIPRWHPVAPIRSLSGYVYSASASTDGDVLYVGTSTGRVYRFADFNNRCDNVEYKAGDAYDSITAIYPSTTLYTSSIPTSKAIEGICVDPNDNNHVVCVASGFSTTNIGRVFESFNGGQSWTTLSNGLPNMPVYDVVLHDINQIVVASELGIWSWDGTQWHEENQGLARLPVYRLIEKELYNESCKVIYAGTHGRGMFRTTTLTAGGCNLTPGITSVDDISAADLGISGLNVFPNPVNSSSKVSLTLDKSADVTLRIFDVTGRLYKETVYRNGKVGENIYELGGNGLTNGTYLLSATVGNKRTETRLFTVAK